MFRMVKLWFAGLSRPWIFGRRYTNRPNRWTDRARAVVLRANSVALERGAQTISPDHLWVGLLSDPGVGIHILMSLGVTFDDLRAVALPPAPASPVLNYLSPNLSVRKPLSNAMKLVVEQAIQESASLGDNYCGTEHLVLALIQTKSCATPLLMAAGMTREWYLAQLEIVRS
jgi:ATP-dependent Clp protease ATP-binding subunit ClpA